jgi:hypothetical protein
MGLVDAADEIAEKKIYEEGGYTALWKYRLVKFYEKCSCC